MLILRRAAGFCFLRNIIVPTADKRYLSWWVSAEWFHFCAHIFLLLPANDLLYIIEKGGAITILGFLSQGDS